MAVLGAACGGPIALASASAFPLRQIEVRGAVLLDPDALRTATGIALGSNLLAADVRAAHDAIARTPFVARVGIHIALPDRIVLDVVEPPLLLRWRVGTVDWLVDGDGRVVGAAGDTVLAPEAAAKVAALPLVDDRRSSSPIAFGDRIPPLSLDIATRLASLVPADLGSRATSLRLELVDGFGFTVAADGPGASWRAVFGIYSATIRPPEMVPGQVRLLRSLLDGRESGIGWVLLADEQAGTFTPLGVQPPPPSFATDSPPPSASPSSTGIVP